MKHCTVPLQARGTALVLHDTSTAVAEHRCARFLRQEFTDHFSERDM